MRFVVPFFFGIFLFLTLWSFSSSSLVSAQTAPAGQDPRAVTKIGTHLVQGDYGGQEKVVKKIIQKLPSRSDVTAYPVVVMMAPETYNDALQLAGTITGNPILKPIIRVNVTPSTEVGRMGGLANFIIDNFPGAPVVIGNEINNQNPENGEWKSSDYSHYANLFNTLGRALKDGGGTNPYGASALDMINGDYSLFAGGRVRENIMADIYGSGLDMSLMTAAFANIYQAGCGEACDPQNAGQWYLGKIRDAGGPSISTSNLYITEYGTTQCQDYDCIQNFYAQNNNVNARLVVGFTRPPGQDTGVQWIHTAPIFCEYWIADSLRVERPTFCGGAEGEIFVYPGIEDQPSKAGKVKMASEYMMTCGNQIRLSGEITNKSILTQDDSREYDNLMMNGGQLSKCPGDPDPDGRCVVKDVIGTVTLSDQLTTIPLFRDQGAISPDPENPKRRMDDLEGFFSANYTQKKLVETATSQTEQQRLEKEQLAPLANGVSRKLISQENMCNNTIAFLESIKKLCDEETQSPKVNVEPNDLKVMMNDRPTPPGSPIPRTRCALDREVEGTGLTYLQILDSIKGTGYSCTQPITVLPEPVHKGFSRIEVTTHAGFKPAYLIHYVNTPPPPEEGDPSNDFRELENYRNWFTPSGAVSLTVPDAEKARYRVIVRKVLVPAGFSHDNDEPSAKNYLSGFMQTVRAVLSDEQYKKLKKDKDDEIADVQSASNGGNSFNPNYNDPTYLNCPECEMSPDSLEAILASRVNAEKMRPFNILNLDMNRGCLAEDLVGEQSDDVIQSLNPAGNPDPVIPSRIPFKVHLFEGKPSNPNPVVIRTYLLLPEEYRNIATYQKAFIDRFISIDRQPIFVYTSTKAENIEENSDNKVGYKFLQLSGLSFSQTGGEAEGQPVVGYKLNYGPAPSGSGVPTSSTPPASSPGGSPTSVIVGRGAQYLKGNIGLANPDVDPNPLVPGGILTRGLWEVMCNVIRPFDGKETVKYTGFTNFLKNGMPSCVGQTKASVIPPTQSTNACKGTTQISGNLATIKAIVNQKETAEGIPTNLLWGILNIEGSPFLRAVRSGATSVVCEANSAGAIGPFQFRSSKCGGTATWESISSGDPCSFTDSLNAAAKYIKQTANYTNIRDAGDDRWYRAAGAYHGLCVSSDQQCSPLLPGRCEGAPTDVGGCGGLNYCQCAFGFND